MQLYRSGLDFFIRTLALLRSVSYSKLLLSSGLDSFIWLLHVVTWCFRACVKNGDSPPAQVPTTRRGSL